MNKQNRNRLTNMEIKLMVAGKEGAGGWVEKVKGLRSWQLQNSHRVVRYSLGNRVNDTAAAVVPGGCWT